MQLIENIACEAAKAPFHFAHCLMSQAEDRDSGSKTATGTSA
jgi:hypothetical protein